MELTIWKYSSETGLIEREPSTVDQLFTSHTQYGSLLVVHSQFRNTARSVTHSHPGS